MMKSSTLEINVDPGLQKKLDFAQKFGYGFLAIFIMAAAFGFFGQSELSYTKEGNTDVIVEYSRFLRQKTGNENRIQINGPFGDSNAPSFWLSLDYVRDIELESFMPAPLRVEQQGDGYRFDFAAAEGQQSLTVLMRLKPQRAGQIRGEIRRRVTDQGLHLDQLSYF